MCIRDSSNTAKANITLDPQLFTDFGAKLDLNEEEKYLAKLIDTPTMRDTTVHRIFPRLKPRGGASKPASSEQAAPQPDSPPPAQTTSPTTQQTQQQQNNQPQPTQETTQTDQSQDQKETTEKKADHESKIDGAKVTNLNELMNMLLDNPNLRFILLALGLCVFYILIRMFIMPASPKAPAETSANAQPQNPLFGQILSAAEKVQQDKDKSSNKKGGATEMTDVKERKVNVGQKDVKKETNTPSEGKKENAKNADNKLSLIHI
eukprot:TRINITY_DN2309_c0_g1_i28.p1 TRINITY_DN2309_c0_g1~~TRINITY_DN2309_c0_g1_i28.p1  ORF type:complete len:299 (-),score=98.84 TRINITY_DN2309_c0_g1_i28:49-837(-)